MTYRTRASIVFSILLITVIVVLYAISRSFFLSSLDQLDQENTATTAQQALLALQSDLQDLERIAVEYSRSNDTYQYVQDRNQNFVKATFN